MAGACHLVLWVIGLLGALAAPAGAAPAWLAPSTAIETGAAPINEVATATLPDGTVIFVWQRGVGATTSVESVTRPPGGPLGPVETLSTAAGAGAPDLAVEDDGRAVVVWTEPLSGSARVRARTRAPGGAWSEAQTLSAAGQNASSPQVDVRGGAAAATWIRPDGANLRAQTAVLEPGDVLFGGADTVSPAAVNVATPQVAVGPGGAAVVVWVQTTGTDVVRAAARPAAGAFTALPDVVTAGDAGDHFDIPVLASDAGGATTVLFSHFDAVASRHAVYAATRGPTGSFGGPDLVSEPLVDSGPGDAYDLAIDDDGRAIAVWEADILRASTRPPGGTFSNTFQPVSGALDGTARPSVVFDDAGTAHVAWADQSLFTTRRPRNGAFDIPATLDAAQDVGGGSPVTMHGPVGLAVDGEGNLAAGWSRRSDTNLGPMTDDVYAVRFAGYDAAPPRVDGLAFPKLLPIGAPGTFSAQVRDVWSPFSVAWTFGDGTGGAGGTVSHAYGAGGTYTVGVTATDAVGNARTIGGVLGVPPAAGGGAGPGGTQRGRRPPLAGGRVSVSWRRLGRGRTKVRRLVVRRLVAGQRVRVTCTARACSPKLSRSFTVRRGRTSLDLTRALRRLTLRSRARLTVQVARSGFTTQVVRFTARARANPKRARLCLPPGARRATAC